MDDDSDRTEDRTADLDQGRMRILDAKPVNLDGFSVTNPELGLVAMHSPFDPEPSLVVADGIVVELLTRPEILDGQVWKGSPVPPDHARTHCTTVKPFAPRLRR